MKFEVGAAHFINGASCFIYKGSKMDLDSCSSSLCEGSNFTVGAQHLDGYACTKHSGMMNNELSVFLAS